MQTVDDSKIESASGSQPAVPVHIAVIMDGNGRWAKARTMPRHAGHRSGVKAVRRIVEVAAKRGVSYLTLFAFSSENWRRPKEEVSRLMNLFLDALQREVDDLHRNNVRLSFIGARDELQQGLVQKITLAEEKTKDNSGLNLIIAVAYGGRWDIVAASKKIASRVAADELALADIDDECLAGELALAGKPDPDLLIRTGGEWFCDCLWPDFSERHFDEALSYFSSRQRRYGHTGEQVGVA